MAKSSTVVPTPSATVNPHPKARLSLVPPGETKHDRFVRLANRRAKAVINGIRALGNLGTSRYERSEEEIAKIEMAIATELNAMGIKLRANHEAEIRNIL